MSIRLVFGLRFVLEFSGCSVNTTVMSILQETPEVHVSRNIFCNFRGPDITWSNPPVVVVVAKPLVSPLTQVPSVEELTYLSCWMVFRCETIAKKRKKRLVLMRKCFKLHLVKKRRKKVVTVSWPIVTVVSDILVARHGACHQRL